MAVLKEQNNAKKGIEMVKNSIKNQCKVYQLYGYLYEVAVI